MTASPSAHSVSSELKQPRWAVISFDECAASDLSYEAAVDLLEQMRAQDVKGLCIITAEAAARLGGNCAANSKANQNGAPVQNTFVETL